MYLLKFGCYFVINVWKLSVFFNINFFFLIYVFVEFRKKNVLMYFKIKYSLVLEKN